MKTIEINEAIEPLSEYVRELRAETLLVTANNRPIAALVCLQNIDKEMLSLSTNPEFIKIIEKAREEFRRGKKLSVTAMKQEISRMDSST